jgi:hypothetical protein
MKIFDKSTNGQMIMKYFFQSISGKRFHCSDFREELRDGGDHLDHMDSGCASAALSSNLIVLCAQVTIAMKTTERNYRKCLPNVRLLLFSIFSPNFQFQGLFVVFWSYLKYRYWWINNWA